MSKPSAFDSFVSQMTDLSHQAMAAKGRGEDEKCLEFILASNRAGQKALEIQDPQIPPHMREFVEKGVSIGKKLYAQELSALIPEEERHLILAVLESWQSLGFHVVGAEPKDKMIDIFRIAKDRLHNDGKDILELVYIGDHLPLPPQLRDIMSAYLEGKATQAETSSRLDAAIETLRKWLPRLLAN